MNLDLIACRRIVEEGALAAADLGLRPDLFIEEGRTVFEFVMDHFRKHGQMPDLITIKTDVKVELSDPAPEPLSYYADKLFRRKLQAEVGKRAKVMVERLENFDPDGAVDVARSIIGETSDLRESKVAYKDVRAGADDRAKEQVQLENLHGVIDGIRTPWAQLDEITRGIHDAELWVIVAAKKTGKCVDKDTLIYDPDTGRLRTIESMYLFGGRGHTLSPSGKLVGVSPAWVDTGRKRCLRVCLRSGRSIVVTPEHPFLTSGGWVRADKLAPGRMIAAARRLPEPKQTVRMKEMELGALALMLADGGSTGHTMSFSKSDPKILSLARRTFRSVGCRMAQSRSNPSTWYIDSSSRGSREKSGLRRLLEAHGLFGVKSKDKFIPDAVFSLPNDQLARFVGVFWSCDGTVVNGTGSIEIQLASYRMVEQLSYLLMRFGIVGRIRKKMVQGFVSWEYRVRSECYDAFKALIPLVGQKKDRMIRHPGTRKPLIDVVEATPEIVRRVEHAVAELGGSRMLEKRLGRRPSLHLITRKKHISRAGLRNVVSALRITGLEWLVSEDIFWDHVVSVAPVGMRKVYDATVRDTHNFVANGIVAHNTWSAVLFMRKAVEQSKRPLLVSMEMPIRSIERRFDALYAQLGYKEFRSGLLGVDGMDRYVAMLKKMMTDGDMWIAGNGLVRTPADVEIMVRDLNPDIVIIDGVYLMSPSRGRWTSKYERVSAVIDELTPMAHRLQVPIIVSTQFNRKLKAGALTGDSSHIGYAYEIAQSAHVVLGLFNDRDLKASGRMIWQLLEHREGEDFAFMTKWDLDNMAFDFIREVDMAELQAPVGKGKGGSSGIKF